MAAEKVRLLVVATRSLAAEVCELLAGEDLPAPALGDGGDETFTLYLERAPHVVILGADLERGDARALAAAIKGGEHGRFVRVILVGEESGPIRNALDAADFEVDRFLGRPLSRKALAFAVSSCASAALADEGASGSSEAPGAAGAEPARQVDDAPRTEIARLPAREPTLVVPPPPPLSPGDEPGTAPDALADEDEADEKTSPARSLERSQLIDEAMEAAIAEFVSDAIATMAEAVPRATPEQRTAPVSGPPSSSPPAPVPAPTSESGWREPTVILDDTATGGPATAPDVSPAADAAQPGDGEATQRSADAPWLAGAGDRDASPFADIGVTGTFGSLDDLDDLDDLGSLDDLGDLDDLDDPAAPDADEATTRERDPAGPASTPMFGNGREVEEPRAGGLARELRRKMSAMAERLFPERVAGGDSQVTVSLPHDANTEIDLAALEQTTGVNEAAPYRGIGHVETFADTNPVIAQGSIAEAERPRVEGAGALGTGDDDVATLLARLHQGGFSGAVELRRGEARKVIHFDEGRPVFASSNVTHDRMGDLLFREGKITREQHARTRERVVASGRRMGELLVEMGFLKPRELLPAVRRHIEDIIYSVFAWDQGQYVIAEREPPGERIRLSRHPAALIVEGVRRKYTPERLAACLGSGDVVLAPHTPESIDAIVGVAGLAGDERAMLRLIDGSRSIEGISVESGLDPLTVAQLGFAMVALGAAEVVFRGEEDVTQTDARHTALVGETDIAIDRQRVLAKLALVEEADYFMLLGVRRDASRFEIQRAYEAARRDYAREAFPEPIREELGDELATIGALIEEAYRILRDDGMRRAYLQHLG